MPPPQRRGSQKGSIRRIAPGRCPFVSGQKNLRASPSGVRKRVLQFVRLRSCAVRKGIRVPTSSKSQVDGILALFPGPVVLYFSRRRILFMLAVYIAALGLMFWLLFSEHARTRDYVSGGHDIAMVCVSILFWGALALRAVLMLLFPYTRSLKLSADGFEIGNVFRRVRLPWRDVSEFCVKARYLVPAKIGGPVDQVIYESLEENAGRSDAKAPRVLPDLYGKPRIRREELARLMNEWRDRALAMPGPPHRVVPLVSGAKQ